mgnify:CR=1 FL=1
MRSRMDDLQQSHCFLDFALGLMRRRLITWNLILREVVRLSMGLG